MEPSSTPFSLAEQLLPDHDACLPGAAQRLRFKNGITPQRSDLPPLHRAAFIDYLRPWLRMAGDGGLPPIARRQSLQRESASGGQPRAATIWAVA